MSIPICSKCKRVIPSEDVNVGTDIAFCRGCNQSHKLSSLTFDAELDENVNLANPPAKTWYIRDGQEFIIGASHRSWGTAIGSLFIAVFWNGIVSVFLTLVISSTLRNAHLPVPDWFPAAKMNGAPMGWGMTLFLWLFLTPFIVIGLTMIGAFLSALGGRTEVRLRHGQGSIFTGIGPLGFRRRFDPSNVEEVRLEEQQWRDRDGDRQRKSAIVIDMRDGKKVKFGSGLPEAQRKFVAGAFRKTLPV